MTTLRRVRLRTHMSLRSAASAGGWRDHVYLLRLEQGCNAPTAKTITRLATVYGVTERTIRRAVEGSRHAR